MFMFFFIVYVHAICYIPISRCRGRYRKSPCPLSINLLSDYIVHLKLIKTYLFFFLFPCERRNVPRTTKTIDRNTKEETGATIRDTGKSIVHHSNTE